MAYEVQTEIPNSQRLPLDAARKGRLRLERKLRGTFLQAMIMTRKALQRRLKKYWQSLRRAQLKRGQKGR
ncbi:hypothetical protein NSE01_39140 [Novosphingobium sediminis]|jgi:hypothetical protein|uniref:Uncharacterized protein n=2 Tax=Novosphingobium sediminis TaxID=707214 RepID=A0A512AQY7_9SPHN|nr:hypothetical protein NSE01_39140 [Novosphingobium sediminis]